MNPSGNPAFNNNNNNNNNNNLVPKIFSLHFSDITRNMSEILDSQL
jgi:hypothetical protein